MRVVLLSFVFTISLFSSVLDDLYIFQANNAIEQKEYQKALLYYEKIKNKNDTMLFNMGNLYYHLLQYHKAIEYYEKIIDERFLHQKYHNLANCAIKLLEYEKAIEYNQKALSYKENAKTRYNLELAKLEYSKILLKLKEQEKKNAKERAGKTVQIDEANMFDDDSFEIDEKLTEAKPSKNIDSTIGISNMQNIQDDQIIINEIEKEDKNILSKLQLSHYTELKWNQKMQISTTLHTLIIPLEKGKIDDSQKPW